MLAQTKIYRQLPSRGLISAAAFLIATLGVHAESARHIALEGQANFRDIGGYDTVDGQTVRWSEVYRSGELPRLTDRDLERVEALGLSTVVNFLTPAEIEDRGAGRLPAGVTELSAPISGNEDELTVLITEARRSGDFSKVPVALNADIHRLLITDEEAKEQYATFLRAAMDPTQRPLLAHCSHGVHRTGTAVAVLLSALGVPWDTVRDDYLLSNTYRANEVERRLTELHALAAEHQGIPEADVDMTNVDAFYRLQGSYIDASYVAILEEYGSVERFVLDGLGLTAAELQTLKEELLE